jgi:hypothetical protein
MDTRRYIHKVVSILFSLGLTACLPAPSLTPYLPPTPGEGATLPALPISTPMPGLPTPICTTDLAYLDDLTIPDYSVVSPGSSLDKQWLVQNTGSCNWDSSYRLRFSGGSLLGANEEQVLNPARAGAEAVIRILFTAPLEAGEYISIWQAVDPNGIVFGEAFLIKIVVVP